ncbi:C2H2 finger domain protein [Lepidopterella palustris CBS 459.81]|uniref:C2H2 finger domain protein n=1 Tax=Lepidopterella palustris CBS 459.81 TaxID=1314670 RepID=A0A8E2DY37_9PEZI|nr:C2H2 finger domain protein [Lepidopterella palustris CBS 459.81]
MHRCASGGDSSSSVSEDDPDYVTDLTDVDEDAIEDDKMSDVQITDEGYLQWQDRPPEYYLAHAEEVNKSDVVRISYADSSTLQFNGIEEQWRQYCVYLGKDPIKSFDAITTGDMSSFFRWKLSRQRGKGGRKLRGTKVSTSLETYWKQFRLVYKRATGRDISGDMTHQMHEVLRRVATDHGLSDRKREKLPMDVEDVREVLQTNLTTTEIAYRVGRYRIQTCFFLQGGFITANRPGALLKLQYRHIVVTILRDPKGGPHRILLELTYEFTKTYLGTKDPNTFPIPEILFDPSLILSPHVFLLGLMFADNVFITPSLQSYEDLSKLDIRPGCNALQLPLKPEMADTYVFRQCVPTSTGWKISNNPLPDSTIRPSIKKIGEITGFLQVARPYCLRYGSGKAFDENGNISDALRNLIMQHADTRTFLRHYLSRRVTADTQAIVRGLEAQDHIMRAACRMSRWIDPERPWRLTAEQSLSVNEDPRIQKLLRQAKLKDKPSRRDEYKQLRGEINKEKQRLRHALLIQIRRDWDREQAVKDIERQLSGVKYSQEIKKTLNLSPERTPQHNRLIETVLSLPGSTLEEEVRRRNAAINAIIAYCGIEEGGYGRVRSAPSAVKREESREAINPPIKALEAAKVLVYRDKRPKICFLCLGNENLSIKQRIFSFCTPGDLSKHFKRKHLSNIREGEKIQCRLCKVALAHKMHLQRHAHEVHGTVSIGG